MTSKELITHIESHLSKIYNSQRAPFGLYEPVFYTLGSGGKRVRPMLCCLSAKLFGDTDDAIFIASAVEIYHNHTLIHDDIMDASPIRRNKPTVFKRWGSNQAILSGDAMLLMAYEELNKVKDKALLAKIYPLFTQMALLVCEGQQYDVAFEETDDVSVDQYLQMIRLKTAELPAYSALMGAIAGGASDEDAALIYNFAVALGLAFQLQDDYLDVYADFKVLGKPTGGDILNNKKTFMLISALEKASPVQREEATRRMINVVSADAVEMRDRTPEQLEKINWFTALYEDLKIPQMARNMIAQFNQEALDSLQKLESKGYDVADLKTLLQGLENRKM
ncbi:polyprenyl synthetase family protein [Falsiporphyromonas endometrii]|uniref:Polyprenyl synthetase family protein n=1 Tax=Falsiporphyromonas endometrii TaxID=1387297 RepID=A0ABV9K6K0_9PORP